MNTVLIGYLTKSVDQPDYLPFSVIVRGDGFAMRHINIIDVSERYIPRDPISQDILNNRLDATLRVIHGPSQWSTNLHFKEVEKNESRDETIDQAAERAFKKYVLDEIGHRLAHHELD